MDISSQMDLIPLTPEEQAQAERAAPTPTGGPPAMPSVNHHFIVEPVSLKAVKVEQRRADAMVWVHPKDLYVVPGFNVRLRDDDYLAHIRDLTESIKTDGFHIDKPISVVATRHPDGHEVLAIINGHSRHEAALQAIAEGALLEVVPVIVQPKTFNATDMTVELVKSNAGRPLSAYERAVVVKRLVNQGLSEAEVGRRLGFTRSYINGLVLLAGAAPRLVQAVTTGEVAASLVIEQIRVYGHSEAERRIAAVIRESQAKGTKVSRASMRSSKFDQAVQRAAGEMHEMLTAVRADPAFAGLAEATRLNLAALLDELAGAREDAA